MKSKLLPVIFMVMLFVVWASLHINKILLNPKVPLSVSTEPLKVPTTTLYVGRLTFKAPCVRSSFTLNIDFFLNDTINSPVINFSETTTNNQNMLPGQQLKDLLASDEKYASLTHKRKTFSREMLGPRLPFPAAMIIYRKPAELWEIRKAQSSNENLTKLVIETYVEAKDGFLTFEYTDIVSWPDEDKIIEFLLNKQQEVISWISAFLNEYEWVGQNQMPPSGFCASRYGRINMDALPLANYTAMASYELIPEERLFSLAAGSSFYVIISSFDRGQEITERSNRLVANRPGYEKVSFEGTNTLPEILQIFKMQNKTSFDAWDILKKRHRVREIVWLDQSTKSFNRENPYYTFYYWNYLPFDPKDAAEADYKLGIWKMILDSAHPVELGH